MVLAPFAETKGARLPGRNPALTMDEADFILLIGASKQTEIIWNGYKQQIEEPGIWGGCFFCAVNALSFRREAVMILAKTV